MDAYGMFMVYLKNENNHRQSTTMQCNVRLQFLENQTRLQYLNIFVGPSSSAF